MVKILIRYYRILLQNKVKTHMICIYWKLRDFLNNFFGHNLLTSSISIYLFYLFKNLHTRLAHLIINNISFQHSRGHIIWFDGSSDGTAQKGCWTENELWKLLLSSVPWAATTTPACRTTSEPFILQPSARTWYYMFITFHRSGCLMPVCFMSVRSMYTNYINFKFSE